MATRLEKLRARRMDPLVKVAGAREAYERLAAEDSAVRYAIGAMQPIDEAYTAKSVEERNRIESQLASGFQKASLNIAFDYQGSLTNDTHIKVYSDIDLLTVTDLFWTIQPPNKPSSPYVGNPVQDLKTLRRQTASILTAAYPKATVDETKDKCVNISGGSLSRRIDVVASNWWYTVEYYREQEKHWLGINILDYGKNLLTENKPFLHNQRIGQRDTETNGGLRKAIRLLKSLKYDNDTKINISSYDVASIAYNVFPSWLNVDSGHDLALVSNVRKYVWYLTTDSTYRDSLDVPNGMRKVFGAGGATMAGLEELSSALDGLVSDIERELSRTLRKIEEARIIY
jgi:hypothetical protein